MPEVLLGAGPRRASVTVELRAPQLCRHSAGPHFVHARLSTPLLSFCRSTLCPCECPILCPCQCPIICVRGSPQAGWLPGNPCMENRTAMGGESSCFQSARKERVAPAPTLDPPSPHPDTHPFACGGWLGAPEA